MKSHLITQAIWYGMDIIMTNTELEREKATQDFKKEGKNNNGFKQGCYQRHKDRKSYSVNK